MEPKQFTTTIGSSEVTVEVGRFAPQAAGACTVRVGDTVVLATACMSKTQRPGIDFLPLMVEYEERLYASGKIKGSRFIKREGRPTDEAILTARLVDRGIRPLFPKHVREDIQVICTVLSYDNEHDPDTLAILGASIALMVGGLPFDGPLSGVRVARRDGQLIVNPTRTEMLTSDLDLVVSGKDDRVLMLEAGAKEVPEADTFAAVKFAMEHVATLNKFQAEIIAAVGKPRAEVAAPAPDEALKTHVAELVGTRVLDLITMSTAEKAERTDELAKIKDEVAETIRRESLEAAGSKDFGALTVSNLFSASQAVAEQVEQRVTHAREYVQKLWDEQLRAHILSNKTRIGGRKVDEIRPLSAAVGLFPRTHGSGFFQRGHTQAVTLCTLGSPSKEQILDGMEVEEKKRYMHHYNFPPFSNGEAKPIRSASRREIGHGALAERALEPVLPSKEQFAYTIRLVTEILSSAGSTSMAATCGSSLSLMDAGVPIAKPVGGVAMGLMTDPADRYTTFEVLTDLEDAEDFAGDMDFKIAGTRDGITAIQMDTKIAGLSLEMVEKTLTQAQVGRMQVLDTMQAAIAEPRKEMSKYAPRLVSFKIETDKIRTVIGKGGEMINKIIDATGVEIDIEDDGTVTVASVDGESLKKAVDWINSIVKDPKPGEKYDAKITRLMDFGAFAEILPGKEGLIHVSQLAEQHVAHPGDVVKIGQVLPVVVTEIDNLGRINLSHLAAIGKSRPMPERPAHGGRGGFGRGGRPGGFGDRGPRRGPPRGGFGGR
ncbi:MAG: polyribonucleotide nucleotidyltransferase [Candidatus Andersenbacteria bacterium]